MGTRLNRLAHTKLTCIHNRRFNKRKRRKISFFRLKIIILTREQSIQVLYTCNGHDLSENVNNKDTDLRMLIKVFDDHWSEER